MLRMEEYECDTVLQYYFLQASNIKKKKSKIKATQSSLKILKSPNGKQRNCQHTNGYPHCSVAM